MFKLFTINNKARFRSLLLLVVFSSFTNCFLTSCSSNKKNQKEEQIIISTSETETNTAETYPLDSINGEVSLAQIATSPHTVVLTGIPKHRLITIYKTRTEHSKPEPAFSSNKSYDEPIDPEDNQTGHFVPGIDLIYGYNLVNIAHFDLELEKINFLFDHPVLIKSLYYPSFIQDSLYKQPINRYYYLVSAYDEDTNKDTLINKKDLRKFYYFNADGTEKTLLIPADYSAVRSEYDPMNDVMYIFAQHDADKNGATDKKDPLHIFWINLKAPAPAKRLY